LLANFQVKFIVVNYVNHSINGGYMEQEAVLDLIQIEAIGPYGVLCNGTWLTVRDPLKASFVKGQSYSVRTVTNPKGKKEIVGIEGTALPVLNPELNKAPTPSFQKRSFYRKPAEDKMTKEEWAAKDKRIGRAGVIQAAVVAVSPHVAKKEDILPAAIALAEGMSEWTYQLPQPK
jgi:hypothetical protein